MTPDAPLQRDAPLPIFLPDVNVWSHKPEPDQPPCLHDGSGRVIRDPRQADPDYQEEIKDERGGTMTYTLALPDTYCTSFCVLKGQVKTGAPL